jgi:hypothetical protein
MSREQELLIKATDLMIDANNAFVELHDLIRHEINSPFHPAVEINEIFRLQLRSLYTLLADDFGIDITVKTQFRLRKPKHAYTP